MGYATRKRWELSDLRHACITFFDPKANETEKATVFRNLGRSFSSVQTIAYSMRSRAQDRCTNVIVNNAYTVHQARYCMGLQDLPFAPRPVRAELPIEPSIEPQAEEREVVGDITAPETLQRVMAMVKFELGTQSSELLLEQAASLEGILTVLKQIAGSLETQTQFLAELANPVDVRPNGRVELPSNGFRRQRS